jgi:pyruvate-formate lyase-activating enzyme
MTAPISFTPEEQAALEDVDRLARAISKVDRDIASANHRILREKARKDRLVARKKQLEGRIRTALETIDTAKTAAGVIP